MTYYIFLTSVTVIVMFPRQHKRLTGVLAIGLLSAFAGSRLNIDLDYAIYRSFFESPAETLGAFNGRSNGIELSIYLIPWISRFFFTSSDTIVLSSFMIFAILGVSTKIFALRKYSENFALSVALYLSYLFLVQEMTTIRAGVASGIFLLSLGNLINREHAKFLVKMGAAFLFHTTSILFVVIWGLFYLGIRLRYYYAALAASLMIALLKVNILPFLHLDQAFARVAVYSTINSSSQETALNIFNFRILISLAMLMCFTLAYRRMSTVKWFDELLKMHIFSLVVFFSLSGSAIVFSLRAYELIAVVQLLLYPMVLHLFGRQHKHFDWLLIVSISAVHAWYLVDISGTLRPYRSWLF